MFGETTIVIFFHVSMVKILNHPIETTIYKSYKWMAITFQLVPSKVQTQSDSCRSLEFDPQSIEVSFGVADCVANSQLLYPFADD